MTTDGVEFAVPDLDGVLDEFAAARAVISMRYHGGIAATLAGRPVVLIDYASKVSSLANELGDGARLLAWEPTDLDTIPDALAAVTGREEQVLATRARLQDRQAANAAAIDRLLDTASS
jgi:polysaccharide pyruvyl transferase WcaK-like protein